MMTFNTVSKVILSLSPFCLNVQVQVQAVVVNMRTLLWLDLHSQEHASNKVSNCGFAIKITLTVKPVNNGNPIGNISRLETVTLAD